MVRDFGKYKVIKVSDVEESLSAMEIWYLDSILDKLAQHRHNCGKIPLTCVVVESDWPEYEEVWGMIGRRVDNEEI